MYFLLTQNLKIMKLKNFLAVFSAVVLASLISVSCKPKNDGPEEPTLTLSAQTLTLNNQAQNPTEPQVQVTTNQTKWNVSTNAEWLTATRKGEGIVVGAQANTLGRDRKAEVIVYAGGLMEKIAVTQSASKIFINVSSETIEVPANGGQFLVAVETNADQWTMEAEQADWFNAAKAGSFVKVDVMANSTDKAREAKVFAKVGAEVKAIRVFQAANKSDAVYFPILDGEMSVYQRAKMEAGRGSIILQVSEPGMGFFGPMPGRVALIPNPDGFINAIYNIPVNIPKLWDKIVIIADTWERVAEGAFIEKLTAEGFVRDEAASTEKRIVFDNATKRFRATILQEEGESGVVTGVLFERYYVQDKDYPTFSKFPYLLKDLLDKSDKKVKDVVAFMTERSYKKESDSKNPKKADEIAAQTFVKEGQVGKEEAKDVVTFYHKTGDKDLKPELLQSLTQFAQIFDNARINLAMWMRPDGMYFPTKEFLALKDKEGFNANAIERPDQGRFFYVTKEDLVLMLRAVEFTDVNPGETSLQFALWYEAGASQAKVSRFGDSYFGKDKKEVKANYAAKQASIERAQAKKTTKFDGLSLK